MSKHPEPLDLGDKINTAIVLFIGLPFLMAGLWVRNMDQNERATLVETKGTVVDIIHRKERDRAKREITTHASVVEFSINDDVETPENRRRFTDSYRSFTRSNGSVVEVLYNPNNPVNTARIATPKEASWYMFGFAGLLSIAGLHHLSPWR
jgi:Protein of unknown function (DUF3592)